MPVAMLVFAPISGWLSDRVGSRALTSGGMILVAISFYWLSRLGLHPSYSDLLPPLLVNGVGTGLFTSLNNSAVMGAARQARVGTAAALASYQDGFLVVGVVAMLAAVTSMVRGSAASAPQSSPAVEQQAIG